MLRTSFSRSSVSHTVVAVLLSCFTVESSAQVKVWEEKLPISTYEIGPADRSPLFYNGRAYQGAQGHIYPYPMLDLITDNRQIKQHDAVYLENEYVKICVLPELGGRIFEAVDKTNGYDFFYRQHVVKPALIGMLGAWISGGVEWNVPHHHRATSYMPVQYHLTENPDGSATIWIGEMELRHRMKWTIGLTLYPGRSYLEATVKIANCTPVAHSMLYWANVSVHSGPDYQVIFPHRTAFGTDHGKREFIDWPVGKGSYRGIDFKGVDMMKRYDEALKNLRQRHFHVWEGGGEIHNVYMDALLLRGNERMQKNQAAEALKDFQAALEYPENLEVAKPHLTGRDGQVWYYIGAAQAMLRQDDAAKNAYLKAAQAKRSEKQDSLSFYTGMALLKLGRKGEAQPYFEGLIEAGNKLLQTEQEMDFFAKFGTKLTGQEREAQAHYLIGLGLIGQGDLSKAQSELRQVLKLNPNNMWAKTHLAELEGNRQ